MTYRRTITHMVGVTLLWWLQPYKVSASGVISNVALNKMATQSSSHDIGSPHLAVDGDPNPVLVPYFTCSHTAETDGIMNAWWKVDLANQYRIEAITLQNRGDCCGDRLRNVSIQIGKQEDEMTEVAFFEGPGTDGSYHVFPVANFIARYVKLEIVRTINAVLVLCEVEVMGKEVQKGRIFNKTEGRKSSVSSLGESMAKSIQQCSLLCLQQSGCAAANYDTLNLSCQLLSSPEPNIAATGYTLIIAN